MSANVARESIDNFTDHFKSRYFFIKAALVVDLIFGLVSANISYSYLTVSRYYNIVAIFAILIEIFTNCFRVCMVPQVISDHRWNFFIMVYDNMWACLVLVAGVLMTVYYNNYLSMLTYLLGAFFSYLATSLYLCDGIMRFVKWKRNE